MEGASRQRGRLDRIAATLLNLAALADRAALRTLPVRFLVLAILWRAEAIAKNFVAGEMGFDRQILDGIARYADDDLTGPAPCWPTLDELLPPTGSTLDAELLAMRLRMLAAILLALAGAGRIHGDGSVGFSGDDWRRWTTGHLFDASTATTLPFFLVIAYPAALYGIIRPPDTS